MSATNVNIIEKISSRRFRADLFYRLAGFAITLPPLRERKVEIPYLADHFNRHFSKEMGFPCPALDDAALGMLMAYDFPGNIRELRNIIERALIECRGGTIRAEHIHCWSLPPDAQERKATPPPAEVPLAAPATADATGGSAPHNLKAAEAEAIRRALAASGGNVAAAARLLGVNRPKLYRMMAALHIETH